MLDSRVTCCRPNRPRGRTLLAKVICIFGLDIFGWELQFKANFSLSITINVVLLGIFVVCKIAWMRFSRVEALTMALHWVRGSALSQYRFVGNSLPLEKSAEVYGLLRGKRDWTAKWNGI